MLAMLNRGGGGGGVGEDGGEVSEVGDGYETIAIIPYRIWVIATWFADLTLA